MTNKIKVKGGNPLRGEVTPIPNKNAILPALVACLLTKETVTYKNVPETSDVKRQLQILKDIGADVDDSNYSNLKITCKDITTSVISSPLAAQYRSSIMFVGPLLARFGTATVPLPGGCVLGKRSIAAHIDAFRQADVTVKIDSKLDLVTFTTPQKTSQESMKHYDIWQLETSVTATENLLMYAVGVGASFTITNAASEPHVSDVVTLLSDMGATTGGKDSNRLTIRGTRDLHGTSFTPRPDHIDIIGYIVAAAITKGEIVIKGANISDIMDGIINRLELFNISIERRNKDLVVTAPDKLFIDPENSGMPMASDDLPKFIPNPWPGFPADGIPVIAPLACKTHGRLLLQNWMYESGLYFTDKLSKLGANIFMADPQRVIISGPTDFKGGEITSPGIIQACKALFLASLCDPVETTIYGVSVLKRRYPDIFEVYKSLGADITFLD